MRRNGNTLVKTALFFIACLALLLGAELIAWMTQRDFGTVGVTNVTYDNYNGIPIRAKLMRPVDATDTNTVPGIVYIHGYQNNRETSDAYCIELARRGFAVLNIDAIGRGNSGIPGDPKKPFFDGTYGAKTSLDYLKSLSFINTDSLGMMGHSLGAEMAYRVALNDPSVKALVISGFAYGTDATEKRPRNMLMIFGKWDEYRKRMTGTDDFESEWMETPQTKKAILADNPRIGVTYGDFATGTARRVFMPKCIHIQESHSRESIAEAVLWMRQALHPDERYWKDAHVQTWPVKEWATLIAMIACFASLFPLGSMLLKTRFFASVSGKVTGDYFCSGRSYWKFFAINGILMWLYLPLIFLLFGIHMYVVNIDTAFPMMMTNAIVWWFVWINFFGLLLFCCWFRKKSRETGLSLDDLGISYRYDRFAFDAEEIAKTILLAAILVAFAYFAEHILEQIFIVDFRFVFPFASDLTPYRAGLAILYFPYLLFGFVMMAIFLHGELRRPPKNTRLTTFFSWTATNTFAMVAPLIAFLMVQYIPLLTTGFIPFVGPGGMLANFVMNLFHIIGVLAIAVPISTWFFQITGRIYLGAFVNAGLVAWMFASSQVIAPIPI